MHSSVDLGYVRHQLSILRRICNHGLRYFEQRKDSRGVDLFAHMKNEVELTQSELKKDG